MNNIWPFPDVPQTVVFTTQDIAEGGEPIVLVAHDPDDGAWQFLSAKTSPETEGRIATLEEIVVKDPSLEELANLPTGWQAIRESPHAPWRRQPIVFTVK